MPFNTCQRKFQFSVALYTFEKDEISKYLKIVIF